MGSPISAIFAFFGVKTPVLWWAAVMCLTGCSGDFIFLFTNYSNFTPKVSLMHQIQCPNYANRCISCTSVISFHHTSLSIDESQLLPWSLFSHDRSFLLWASSLLFFFPHSLGWHIWFVFHFQFFTFHLLFSFHHGVMSIRDQFLDLDGCQRASWNQSHL